MHVLCLLILHRQMPATILTNLHSPYVSGTISFLGDAGATLSQSMNTPNGKIQVFLRAFENGTQTNVLGTVGIVGSQHKEHHGIFIG